MRKLLLTIVFATILFLPTVFSQENTNNQTIEFKTVKYVGDKLNVYFDIEGITDTSQFVMLSQALTDYSEVYKCNLYKSSYNSYRCMLISTPDINASTVQDILKEQGFDYDLKTVKVKKIK